MLSLRCADWMPPVNTSCMHAAAHFAMRAARGGGGITRASASTGEPRRPRRDAAARAPSTGSASSGQSAAGANAGAVSTACHARSNASAVSILRQRLRAHIRSRAVLPRGPAMALMMLCDRCHAQSSCLVDGNTLAMASGKTRSPSVKMDARREPVPGRGQLPQQPRVAVCLLVRERPRAEQHGAPLAVHADEQHARHAEAVRPEGAVERDAVVVEHCRLSSRRRAAAAARCRARGGGRSRGHPATCSARGRSAPPRARLAGRAAPPRALPR